MKRNQFNVTVTAKTADNFLKKVGLFDTFQDLAFNSLETHDVYNQIVKMEETSYPRTMATITNLNAAQKKPLYKNYDEFLDSFTDFFKILLMNDIIRRIIKNPEKSLDLLAEETRQQANIIFERSLSIAYSQLKGAVEEKLLNCGFQPFKF